ncbi:family 2 encapsulin nanocompartment cargo protein polyprenyl transferase [Allokutzneria multivorans]|uniref:Family 2 encapsulin nanocompartment cargo protein polyprenyl transferase n=1 Tax=Allokutzneria multivorans TaxID=1142134 RepID=A0ABP7QXA9_9PSEU
MTAHRLTWLPDPPSATCSAGQILDWARRAVEPALRTAIDRLSEPTRRIAGYHLGWWDAHGHPGEEVTAGKALRPALTLLCAHAVGASTERAVPVAAAVELVHNFSLLHDDIIDGDRLRRQRPTAWSVFGAPAAILAGDALLALAVRMLAAHPGMARLGITLVELVNGQSADIAFTEREEVGLAECVAMAGGKTAALLGCACALGALAGGAEDTQVERWRRFGHHLGLSFQLVDDLLGIWGDPARTGKPVGSDLRAGKKSLPVVAALTAGNDAARRLARLYSRPTPLEEADVAVVTELIERAGGRAWAQREADRHRRIALTRMGQARPASGPATHLATLTALITRRDH